VIVLLLLSTLVNTSMIAAELKKLLDMGITLLEEVLGDDEIRITSVPPFALRKNLPKLQGVDVAASEYNRLKAKQKQTRRAWHVEMETQYIKTFERLRSPELTLRQIIPKYLSTRDGKSPLVAEIHQIRPNGPVEAVVPKVKVADVMVSAMSCQMAAFLKYYLLDYGLEEDLVTRLVVASCCPTLVLEIYQYEWDEENQELKLIKEKEDESQLAAFEKADWYFDLDKMSVSPLTKKDMNYSAPEAVFNWDEAQLVNTLHVKNDARRAAARNRADGNLDSEEEEFEGSEPNTHEKLPNDMAAGNVGMGRNQKSISWSPNGSSVEHQSGSLAAGGG
jgi:hypothetical protein